jgi:hypothetical protein
VAPNSFQGETTDGGCGQLHGPFPAEDGTRQITVGAATVLPDDGADDDITINLYAESDPAQPVASQDLLPSPEVLTYAPSDGVATGWLPRRGVPVQRRRGADHLRRRVLGQRGLDRGRPRDAAALARVPDQPELRYLEGPVRRRPRPVVLDQRQRGLRRGAAEHRLARALGCRPAEPAGLHHGRNNASAAISEASFLTPDTVFDRPVSPTRDYDFAWEDKWFQSSCDPTNFATDNDDDASTTNLFTRHNRMHDWSYFLGFTELNSNLQKSNFGNTGPARENDPELGQSQAGRLTVNGRDNAKQITLNRSP